MGSKVGALRICATQETSRFLSCSLRGLTAWLLVHRTRSASSRDLLTFSRTPLRAYSRLPSSVSSTKSSFQHFHSSSRSAKFLALRSPPHAVKSNLVYSRMRACTRLPTSSFPSTKGLLRGAIHITRILVSRLRFYFSKERTERMGTTSSRTRAFESTENTVMPHLLEHVHPEVDGANVYPVRARLDSLQY